MAGKSHQASLDHLTQELAKGNFNPGCGTKRLFADVMEARTRDGARVYFRVKDGLVEVLGKSTKHNQQRVIGLIKKQFGY